MSRDSNLHILPLRYKSIRKPLWTVLPYYFITIALIWKADSALAINTLVDDDVNIV